MEQPNTKKEKKKQKTKTKQTKEILEKATSYRHRSWGRERAPAFGRLCAPAGAQAWMERGRGTGAGKAPEMPPVPQNWLLLSTGQEVYKYRYINKKVNVLNQQPVISPLLNSK